MLLKHWLWNLALLLLLVLGPEISALAFPLLLEEGHEKICPVISPLNQLEADQAARVFCPTPSPASRISAGV
ncbi:hypothetical protein BJ322DRAFT_1031224 [Thelephora terrestris]|uniref:Uncharacterized protein n=1 Tax=Thelephora terrestris TaxID=56493 RepID=A0A9P6HR52_9AGAM|nr:hypothetical protein BJ322DRAFT_1031224 [Thelephora terrestris]